jgi:ubiquinone/menaquinone biosynthesis C-methylase UbiE
MDERIFDVWQRIEKNHWWYKARRSLVKKLVKDGNILEIGCGVGSLISALEDKNRKVIGIDPSKTAIKMAKQKIKKMNLKNIFVVVGLGEKISFSNDFFDSVICTDVLEHIKEDLDLLIELRRILKKGGIAIISVPALQKLWGKQDDEQHHYRRYSMIELERLLEKANFKIIFIRYWNSILFPLILISRKFTKTSLMKELEQTPDLINSLFFNLLKIEEKISLPFGVSLIAKVIK